MFGESVRANGEDVKLAFRVSTGHHQNQKAYLTTGNRVSMGETFTREIPMDIRNENNPYSAEYTSTNRYSRKALEELHAENVAKAKTMLPELEEFVSRINLNH